MAKLAILTFNDTSERKMKSTNRQFHLNQTNFFIKMCLLNCILISIVTLTQSLAIPEPAQSPPIILTSVIAEHPKFHGTFRCIRKCCCCRLNVFLFKLLFQTHC